MQSIGEDTMELYFQTKDFLFKLNKLQPKKIYSQLFETEESLLTIYQHFSMLDSVTTII